jgi:hypothetical protein
MRINKSGHDILSLDDSFKYAPPKMGELHWKDNRSAKELAKAWFRKGIPKPPEELVALLKDKFGTEITFDEAKPECVIRLDDFDGEHRNCDLVVLCKVGAQRIAINVEAKADEPFGNLIGKYYEQTVDSRQKVPAPQSNTPPRPSNVPARIQALSKAMFGREPDETIRKLRYQLLHAAAAALIEAKLNDAELGLFLVHEFRPANPNKSKAMQNATDWENFVHTFPELANNRIEENQILGPVSVPGGGRVPTSLPLYLGKLITRLE